MLVDFGVPPGHIHSISHADARTLAHLLLRAVGDEPMDDRIYDSAELRALWNAVRQPDVVMAREVLAPVKARPETLDIMEAHFENKRASVIAAYGSVQEYSERMGVPLASDDVRYVAAGEFRRAHSPFDDGIPMRAKRNIHAGEALSLGVDVEPIRETFYSQVPTLDTDGAKPRNVVHGWSSCPDIDSEDDLMSCDDAAITCHLCKLREKGAISFADETGCGAFVQRTKDEIDREQSAAFMDECAMRAMVQLMGTHDFSGASTQPEIVVAVAAWMQADAMNAERLRRKG